MIFLEKHVPEMVKCKLDNVSLLPIMLRDDIQSLHWWQGKIYW